MVEYLGVPYWINTIFMMVFTLRIAFVFYKITKGENVLIRYEAYGYVILFIIKALNFLLDGVIIYLKS